MRETTITIQCKNTGKEYSVVPGTSLLQFLEICGYSGNKPALAAYVDNKLKELSYELFSISNCNSCPFRRILDNRE